MLMRMFSEIESDDNQALDLDDFWQSAALEDEEDRSSASGITLEEAKVLAGLINEYAQPPAWISFSCRDGDHICDGTPIVDAVQAVTNISPGLLAMGVNCTAPAYVEDAVKNFASATNLPVLAYPNSGEGWNAVKRRWEGENDPRDYCTYARKWQVSGASLIGGCCRTGPGHIAGLHEMLHGSLATGSPV